MKNRREKNIKFLIYIALIILVNLVLLTLFKRFDLTAGKHYTLSGFSRSVVSQLQEPLTVRIFISEDLPVPYNRLDKEVTDLMEEFALKGNRNFNYEINKIDKDRRRSDKRGNLFTDIASGYGISPFNIESFENNQISVVSVYMGAAIIHGDTVETIPGLGVGERQGTTFLANLEYQFATIFEKISRKNAAFLAMESPIEVTLYYPEPLLSETRNSEYTHSIEEAVDELKQNYFDKVVFQQSDATLLTREQIEQYNFLPINFSDGSGNMYESGAGIVVKSGAEEGSFSLFQSFLGGAIPVDTESARSLIEDSIEKVINIKESIGYLESYRTLSRYSSRQDSLTAGGFTRALSDSYNIKGISSLDEIPEDITTLILAGPKDPFSDWDLFQLDQFLMKGNSLALFLDNFEEAPQTSPYQQAPPFVPVKTELDKLLNHYGVGVQEGTVMDKQSNIFVGRDQFGNLSEQKVYYQPQPSRKEINQTVSAMRGIKSLHLLLMSPLETTRDDITPITLFSSSPDGWIEKQLADPNQVSPPFGNDAYSSYPFAYLLDGPFESYFKGKELPQPPEREESEEQESNLFEGSSVTLEAGALPFIESGERGKILLVGSSYILIDTLLEIPSNRVAVLNMIDALNGRDDFAVMRTKSITASPLNPGISDLTKSVITRGHIYGVPIAVLITGLFVYFSWNRRKERIKVKFEKRGGEA